eukprot:2958188-Rhodomonas_salina.1
MSLRICRACMILLFSLETCCAFSGVLLTGLKLKNPLRLHRETPRRNGARGRVASHKMVVD